MKKGNLAILVAIVVGCTIIAVIMSYGLINVMLSVSMNNAYENEEFDALVNTDNLSINDFVLDLEQSSFIGGLNLNKADIKIDNTLDSVIVQIKYKDIDYSNEFILNSGMIETKWHNDENLDDITMEILDIAYMTKFGIDNVITDYFNEDEKQLYRIDNVGMEFESDKVVVNLNKELNLIEFKSLSITEADVAKYASDLTKEKMVQIANDNVMAIKTGYNGEIKISVAEYGEITNAAYESLINILAVALDYSELYYDFLYSHSYTKIVDEQTEEYKLEVEPVKEVYEQNYFGDKPMIRITIFN